MDNLEIKGNKNSIIREKRLWSIFYSRNHSGNSLDYFYVVDSILDSSRWNDYVFNLPAFCDILGTILIS